MSRYDLTDFEWRVIKPLLPNKSRGVARVDDRRVLNGIFWVLRSGAPWRDVPERYGPYTTCYNRFRRWTMAGIWDRLMEAVTSPSKDGIAMIDGTSVRVHHLAATLTTEHPDRCLGRSRGDLTTKIHAVTDGIGLPIKIAITPGHAHDLTAAKELLTDLSPGGMVLADKAYDADWLRAEVRMNRSWANIPPKSNRKRPIVFSPWLYRKRNLIERFFSKLKCYRRIATRYEKLGTSFLAMTRLACVRLTLRHNESTA
ncbi:IS5/IS1182 family transposase [Rhizobium leguminosarum bv. trifolii]|uniref:IS5/IS1182 family transposase n=1 Tax=Rhizobium leguminosarum bv. trifolii TaxID=386 RepID=A0A3E1BHZ5_RHILT|nr:IS5 family transposase [Rhizobium leguminosarum]RFB92005.1 IS5/IS1182 family transposase [Rhizobium leguminosarum bv. trifolii]RFB92522.1 IS5/IS1182 family transposase [Rhizobium leguminosarum bv. trifolii]